MLTTTAVTANSRELGFSTVDSARRTVTMMLRATPTEDRAWMPTEHPQNSTVADTTGGNGAMHFLITVPCFMANPTPTLPLTLHPTLPHIKFPIGDGKKEVTLLVALDSCAGVNLGDLAFHKVMAEQFPALVAEFKPLSAYQTDDITIGSADATNHLLTITHVITYHTPLRINGKEVRVCIRLSTNAVAIVLMSINFLQKMKAIWNFDATAPSIYLQTINKAFTTSYQLASKRTPPTGNNGTDLDINLIMASDSMER